MAQSPYIPIPGQKPTISDLPWLLIYSARALFELGRARLAFTRFQAKEIPARNKRASDKAKALKPVSAAALSRISYITPRLSDRLPWRSDCLIQAIAAQNWLLSIGVASEIQIGVENPKDGQFGAHAWLIHDKRLVTGGNIQGYSTLLASTRTPSDSPKSNNASIDEPNG